MYKKKKDKKTIIILSICLLIGIIVNVFITDRNLTIFEKGIKDGLLTIQKVILTPLNLLSNKNDYYEIDNENVKIIELENEINYLKDTLELNNVLIDSVATNATVIGRSISYWEEEIIIDKGEYHGLTTDMAVVVKNGLIGKIVNTTTFTSTVRLLTASLDSISVKIDSDGIHYGILTKYDDSFIIEGISQRVEIKNNSIVTTTGMGNIFPSGIVVGTVTNTTTDNFDLAKVLEVKSNVNFDDLKYVTVLKRFK